MDISITIIFHIVAIFFMLFGLFESRNMKSKDDDKQTNLVVILYAGALIMFFLAAVTMMYVTDTFVSPVTGELTHELVSSYRPLAWIGILFSFISGILLTEEALEALGKGDTE